jgi:hypothetical protein
VYDLWLVVFAMQHFLTLVTVSSLFLCLVMIQTFNHRTITVQPFYLHCLFLSKLMVVIAISDCVHQVFVLLKEKPNNIQTPVIYNGWFIMFFVFIYVYWCPTRFLCQMMLVSLNSNTTGVISGAGTASPSGAPASPRF